mgnify:CR=1 FL=1
MASAQHLFSLWSYFVIRKYVISSYTHLFSECTKRTDRFNEYIKEICRPIEYYIQYIRVSSKRYRFEYSLAQNVWRLIILRKIKNMIYFRVLTVPWFSENRELFEIGKPPATIWHRRQLFGVFSNTTRLLFQQHVNHNCQKAGKIMN